MLANRSFDVRAGPDDGLLSDGTHISQKLARQVLVCDDRSAVLLHGLSMAVRVFSMVLIADGSINASIGSLRTMLAGRVWIGGIVGRLCQIRCCLIEKRDASVDVPIWHLSWLFLRHYVSLNG